MAVVHRLGGWLQGEPHFNWFRCTSVLVKGTVTEDPNEEPPWCWVADSCGKILVAALANRVAVAVNQVVVAANRITSSNTD